MDAFHSEKGRKMYLKLPKSKPPSKVAVLQADAEVDTPTQLAFRALRDQLEADGWWIRDKKHEYTLLGIWGALVGVGALVAPTVPYLSTFLLSLSMTAAGWLGHDYIHGVDTYTDKLRQFAAVAAGLLPVWWSDKHNKHHALSKFIFIFFSSETIVLCGCEDGTCGSETNVDHQYPTTRMRMTIPNNRFLFSEGSEYTVFRTEDIDLLFDDNHFYILFLTDVFFDDSTLPIIPASRHGVRVSFPPPKQNNNISCNCLSFFSFVSPFFSE